MLTGYELSSISIAEPVCVLEFGKCALRPSAMKAPFTEQRLYEMHRIKAVHISGRVRTRQGNQGVAPSIVSTYDHGPKDAPPLHISSTDSGMESGGVQ